MKYIGMTLAALMSINSHAVTYENKMDKAYWNVESSPLKCSMSQAVRGVMVASFYQKAGHENAFKGDLSKFNNVNSVGVLIESPFWSNNQINPIEVTSSKVLDREFEISGEDSRNIIVSLQDGYVARFKLDNGDSVKVLPTGFKDAVTQYNDCMVQLIPAGLDKVELSVFRYPTSVTNISKKFKRQLDNVVAYYHATSNVDRIVVDGHSDKAGKSLINRDLSKKRAQLIKDYLQQKGIPIEKLVVRFHGDMYPIASNSNSSGRYTNRRVTVRIQENSYPMRKEAYEMDVYDHFIETHKVVKNLGKVTFKDEDEVFRAIEAAEIIDSLNPAGNTLMVERIDPNNTNAVDNMASAIEAVSGIDADGFAGDEDGLRALLKNSQEKVLEDHQLEVKDRVILSESTTGETSTLGSMSTGFNDNLLSETEMLKVKNVMNANSNQVFSESDKNVIESIVSDNVGSVPTTTKTEQGVLVSEEDTYNPFSYFDLSKSVENEPKE
jgi:outer membrane protein OmpA-like peptidoglycan-associated protein